MWSFERHEGDLRATRPKPTGIEERDGIDIPVAAWRALVRDWDESLLRPREPSILHIDWGELPRTRTWV